MSGRHERLTRLQAIHTELAFEASALAARIQVISTRIRILSPMPAAAPAAGDAKPIRALRDPELTSNTGRQLSEAVNGKAVDESRGGGRAPRMLAFPKIEQFRNACQEVAWYAGAKRRALIAEQYSDALSDEFVEAIAAVEAAGPPDLPTIDFVGTVKLHGTNAAVCRYGDSGVMWPQSRKNVLTGDRDNAGFRAHVDANKANYERLLGTLWRMQANVDAERLDGEGEHRPLATEGGIVCVYGEWCGRGIQKGVAVSNLDPMLVVFAVAFAHTNDNDTEENAGGGRRWMAPDLVRAVVESERVHGWGVHHILEFDHFKISIDFNHPELAQDTLSDITQAVEAQCPVAAALGASGVGEGVVWTGQLGGRQLRFKVKGEEHTMFRRERGVPLAAPDVAKVSSAQSFADCACTPARLEQGIDELFIKTGRGLEMSGMGDMIKWVQGDILSEEADTLRENGLHARDVLKPITSLVREWFTQRMRQGT